VKFEDVFPIADLGEKDLRVKYVLGRFAHNRPPLAQTTVVKSRAGCLSSCASRFANYYRESVSGVSRPAYGFRATSYS
jgi:hypothetical protein